MWRKNILPYNTFGVSWMGLKFQLRDPAIIECRMHIITAGSMDILLVISLFLFQMALLLLHQSTIPDLGTIALLQKIVAHIINLSKYIMILVEEVLLIQPSP